MLNTRRVISHSVSLRYFHRVSGVHPTYHQIRRDSPIAIRIAGESNILRTYTAQLIQIQFDILGSTFLVGDASDISAMFSTNNSQIEVGTYFCH